MDKKSVTIITFYDKVELTYSAQRWNMGAKEKISVINHGSSIPTTGVCKLRKSITGLTISTLHQSGRISGISCFSHEFRKSLSKKFEWFTSFNMVRRLNSIVKFEFRRYNCVYYLENSSVAKVSTVVRIHSSGDPIHKMRDITTNKDMIKITYDFLSKIWRNALRRKH